jgi:hypothetical protein
MQARTKKYLCVVANWQYIWCNATVWHILPHLFCRAAKPSYKQVCGASNFFWLILNETIFDKSVAPSLQPARQACVSPKNKLNILQSVEQKTNTVYYTIFWQSLAQEINKFTFKWTRYICIDRPGEKRNRHFQKANTPYKELTKVLA